MMLDWFIHFFKGPNLFHPRVWKGRLQPTNFRALVAADIPQCLELYELNRPGRLPDGWEARYRSDLESASNYTLVVERDDRIIATGGISKLAREDVVILSYGLVHPAHQSRGLGIALTMARLALLEPTPDNYSVFIGAVAKSVGYYGRLGFGVVGTWSDAQGATHPYARLLVSAKDIRGCRELLQQHGITWPDRGVRIPMTETESYPEWLSALGLRPLHESNKKPA
jgi:N-acetylglutamate synthase-like GNAT family acetyltransferase